ncbi:hypothetical protein PgNI_05695 [Pyricularia grisea]|uniref:Uncharacterized protein n=1 Tax=Pyricularia grisea TaxID=148305 RepID=A0A6P8B7A2_PYRGI|nr:hypothetical protein PgNI_05695 [Pyricularia grisea]TLD11211.1 hypothetical protein PgNI_05695 [Pyricularia grisea]
MSRIYAPAETLVLLFGLSQSSAESLALFRLSIDLVAIPVLGGPVMIAIRSLVVMLVLRVWVAVIMIVLMVVAVRRIPEPVGIGATAHDAPVALVTILGFLGAIGPIANRSRSGGDRIDICLDMMTTGLESIGCSVYCGCSGLGSWLRSNRR